MTPDIESLLDSYRLQHTTPREIVSRIYAAIRDSGERPVWIELVPEEENLARIESLGPFHKDLPLYGVPFAIKDNIDLAGAHTTAACPDFSYLPARSATVVERLIAAGAIPIGKTNLDQFATGLTGSRSPYGACSSVIDARYISGGSSSGSAVALASGLVPFALGTDTAGSGRIPAAFNGITGFKPTRGLLSTLGVVPACRTLDCVSIFARNSKDAARVFDCARAFDGGDPYSRPEWQPKAWPATGFRFGVPRADQLQFFGDQSAPAIFDAAAQHLEEIGGCQVEIDFGPFRDAAGLLYSGPWVAERFAAIRSFLAEHPQSLFPVTEKIIAPAASLKAVSAFEGMYRLAEIKRATEPMWDSMDFLLLPTAGNCYTHEELSQDPIGLNTNLGFYTNFVNLLDLAAIAVPFGTRASGMPFGVTLVAPAWSDDALLEMGARFEDATVVASYCPAGYVPLAVCGAHLSGQPLNYQLSEAGAFLIEACRTSPDYRLYALRGTTPAKPGLVRVPHDGASIRVEVWAVPQDRFGKFTAAVPAPLGIGTCQLESGRVVKGFICEPMAIADAEDITHFAGWILYLEQST